MTAHHSFRVERSPYARGFRLWAVLMSPDGSTFQPATYVAYGEPIENGLSAEHIDPLFELDQRGAQRLFDELWAAGLRPQQDQSEGERSAMKAHIGDLRTVMLRLLPKEAL